MPVDTKYQLVGDCKERVAFDLMMLLVLTRGNKSDTQYQKTILELYRKCLQAVKGEAVTGWQDE